MARRRPTLRRRLALLVTVAVGGAVLISGVVSYGVTKRNLTHNVDRQLRDSATQAAAQRYNQTTGTQRFPGGPFGGGTPPGDTGAGDSNRPRPVPGITQFISTTGVKTVPDFNGASQEYALPVDSEDLAIAASGTGYRVRSVTVDGTHLRVATAGAGTAGAVQVAQPLDAVDNTTHDILLLLLATALGGMIIAGVAGVFVTRSSLKPVGRVADAAAEVARTQDLSALIPEAGPEEIAEIARSVNSMLVALDTAKSRQRQLIDDTSHELRTPLTSLRTNIDVLLRVEAAPDPSALLPADERAHLLDDLRKQMIELGDLVTQLVQLARDETQPEDETDVDVRALLVRAVDRVQLRAPRAQISTDIAAGLALRGRAGVLERAVVNLLDNAVKFGPADGAVLLTAREGVITVSDQGPGVAPEERTKVFDRFYRSARSRTLPGSGLGLAIVAEAAAEHGGSAEVQEAPGGGALMVLRLPGLREERVSVATA
ncbi:MAG TPA: HAMP domain-containing sensor histidine kinase [Mycobacteriales bacterium]|nr:HAMP domain-containing sensor histidine kinase [Mycobacteriales bacterium]